MALPAADHALELTFKSWSLCKLLDWDIDLLATGFTILYHDWTWLNTHIGQGRSIIAVGENDLRFAWEWTCYGSARSPPFLSWSVSGSNHAHIGILPEPVVLAVTCSRVDAASYSQVRVEP